MALQKLRLATLKLLGRFPKTEEVEANDKALREEYDEFLRFGQSDDYKHFTELAEFAKSGEPQRVKEELRLLKYPNSQEYLNEQEFKKLSKDKAIKNYHKVKDSQELSIFKSIELSGKPIRYSELQQIVESPEYKQQRKEHKKNKSDEYQKELEYKKLKKDKELKHFFKLKKWTPINDYFHLEGSDTINRYNQLKEYLQSQEFIERKAYLLSKKKYEQSETYQKVKEYESLIKSEKIVWFHSLQNSKKFDEIKRWELTFNDDFTDKSLDAKKWLTRYFWGEALLKNSYSLAADKHWYPDTKNIDINDSILTITTRKEDAEGMAWDLRYGFIPKSFNYTSGIISTGQSHRQKYGRFEAKVKFTATPGVYHSFWLVGDKMLPHVDIFRHNGKKLQGSYFWQNGTSKKPKKDFSSLSGFDATNSFFILSLDWTPEKMVWKINGVPFKEVKKNLPESPAYLVISSGVTDNTDENQLPVSLEVDWIKCWRDTQLNS